MVMTSGKLARLLARVSRRTQAVVFIAGLLNALTALVVITTGLLLFDACWPLAAPRLAAWDIALIAVAGVILAHAVIRTLAERLEPRRTARRIESLAGIQHNRLVNAIELSAAHPSFGSVELSQLAGGLGETTAQTLLKERLVDRRPLLRAARILLATLLVVGLLAAWRPGLFHAGISRFLEPWSDHPPFTTLKFEVATSPQTPQSEERAELSVQVSGDDLPADADVVWVGAKPIRQPMSRAGDGRFSLHIERAGQTREFYIATPRGRSRRYLFKVEPQAVAIAGAMDERNDLAARAEVVGAAAVALAARSELRDTNAPSQAAKKAALIAELSARIAREAGAKQAMISAGSSEAEAMRAALEALRQAAERSAISARSAADSLESGKGNDESGQESLSRAGRELQQKAHELAEASRRAGQGKGTGRGDGEGQTGSTDGASDASNPVDPARSATGRRMEWLDPGAVKATGQAGGDMTGVPWPYRDAAAAYFRRIAEDSR